MIGNFQKNTCTGVEVDPTLAAQPRAVGIGDPTTNLLSEHAFVDLRGGIRSRHQEQPRIWFGRPGTRFCHQRQTPTVETYNPETLSWLVQPLGLSTRSKVHTIDLVGQRPDRSPGDNWVGVGGIHGLGPDDAIPGAEHRIEILRHLSHRSVSGIDEPQAGQEMLEPAHEVYAVVRIVEDDWLSIELDPALLENMVPAGGDVHHVDQKAARLSDAYIGVMGPIRGDCRPRDRQPARERSVVILTVVATRVDDHLAGGERDKRVDGLGVLLVDRQPAAESYLC